jgi:hypothetical protein
MSTNLITALKTGKGNNVKLSRQALEKATKTIKRHSTQLPQPEEGKEPIAYEYGALDAGGRLALIADNFREMLDARPGATAVKIARANLQDLIERLKSCATELADKAQSDIQGVAEMFQNILTPPVEEPKAEKKSKKSAKKSSEPAEAPGI